MLALGYNLTVKKVHLHLLVLSVGSQYYITCIFWYMSLNFACLLFCIIILIEDKKKISTCL